jgi:hypothetical protein
LVQTLSCDVLGNDEWQRTIGFLPIRLDSRQQWVPNAASQPGYFEIVFDISRRISAPDPHRDGSVVAAMIRAKNIMADFTDRSQQDVFAVKDSTCEDLARLHASSPHPADRPAVPRGACRFRTSAQ